MNANRLATPLADHNAVLDFPQMRSSLYRMHRGSLYLLSIVGSVTLAFAGALAQPPTEEAVIEAPETAPPSTEEGTLVDPETEEGESDGDANAVQEPQSSEPEMAGTPAEPPPIHEDSAPALTEVVPPAPGTEEGPPSSDRCLIIVDAASIGVAPVVAQHITSRMRELGSQMGYSVLSRPATVTAARRVRMPFPPNHGDLWRTAFAASCHRVGFARVWARNGRYEFEMVVGSLDGTGPFTNRGSGSAQDLLSHVGTIFTELLPAASDWDQNRYEELSTTLQNQTRAVATPPEPEPEPPPPFVGRRFQLAFSSESAIGTSSEGFYNHLLGVRADYRMSPKVLLGVYVGYANLSGRNARASNVLSYAQLESRIRLRAHHLVSFPMRFGFGYLPLNGPFIRMSAGINFPIGDRMEFGLDLLAPTFWVLPDSTPISLNLSAEIIFRI